MPGSQNIDSNEDEEMKSAAGGQSKDLGLKGGSDIKQVSPDQTPNIKETTDAGEIDDSFGENKM